jgi:hypothetical protein
MRTPSNIARCAAGVFDGRLRIKLSKNESTDFERVK